MYRQPQLWNFARDGGILKSMCLACARPLPTHVQGKTQAAAAAAPADTVDELMLKLAALGSAALGANAESAAAALAGSAAAGSKEKQPRRMKLLRQQVVALQEKQQQLEEEMDRKEQVRGRHESGACYVPPRPTLSNSWLTGA